MRDAGWEQERMRVSPRASFLSEWTEMVVYLSRHRTGRKDDPQQESEGEDAERGQIVGFALECERVEECWRYEGVRGGWSWCLDDRRRVPWRGQHALFKHVAAHLKDLDYGAVLRPLLEELRVEFAELGIAAAPASQ